MVQATDHRLGHDLAPLGWIDFARLRSILIEGAMRSYLMIIFEEGRDDSLEVRLEVET